jgi:predicted RNase H-like HicB family nuclease
MIRLEYTVVIEPLSDEDGGGFLARVPELQGCMSDGETPQEALTNVYDAMMCWIEATEETGRQVPEPMSRIYGVRRDAPPGEPQWTP